MHNLFSVENKVAIVTGGSRGIGAMIAQGLVEGGAKVYITARKVTELESTAAQLSKTGDCIAIVSDLSNMEGIKNFVHAIRAKEQRIDILINNAGATWGDELETFPEAGWDKIMDLNVKAPFFLSQQFLPLLEASASHEDPARIINISSINALRNAHMTNYSYTASKAAVLRMTEHLAADLVKRHITVNAIAPGIFPSNMTKFMLQTDEAKAALGSMIPRGRIGSPEDIAGTVIYLCSKAAAWVTGNTIVLDGGMVANS